MGLAPLVPDIEAAATRIVANHALRLLMVYLMPWRENFDVTDPTVLRLAVNHVHDLVVLALGATRDAAAVANGRGVRAARLQGVKVDIAANLTSRDLSVAAVALRQRVTPRDIHMLFDAKAQPSPSMYLPPVLPARAVCCATRAIRTNRSPPSPPPVASATSRTSTAPSAAAMAARLPRCAANRLSRGSPRT
jgi:hypothetical protein